MKMFSLSLDNDQQYERDSHYHYQYSTHRRSLPALMKIHFFLLKIGVTLSRTLTYDCMLARFSQYGDKLAEPTINSINFSDSVFLRMFLFVFSPVIDRQTMSSK